MTENLPVYHADPQPVANTLPATVEEIKGNVQLIQRVMEAVMLPDVHYGVIPGTDNKPVLLKPGSEKILTTFRIAVDPQVHDLSTPDEIRYRVHAVGRHQLTGIVVGTGIGECSSNEEKYRWRSAVPAEYEETPPERRRIKHKKSKGGGSYAIQQVRANPSDVANTVLKMAKKRAQVDLCLTATAASDIFTQDIDEDDLPAGEPGDEPQEAPAGPQRAARPSRPASRPAATASRGGAQERPPAPPGSISEKQGKLLFMRLREADIDRSAFCAEFGIEKLDHLPREQMDAALSWIADGGPTAEQPPAQPSSRPAQANPDDDDIPF